MTRIWNKHKQSNTPLKPKVFVAMSGGVDSSVTALLLKKSKKYEIVGCFIKGWYPEGFACLWKKDRRDVINVCAKLGIPFVTIDGEKEYKKKVVDYMLKEYKNGRTPNPDVMCNKNVKFGSFLKQAKKMGANYIATGHYVRLGYEFPNEKQTKKIKSEKYDCLYNLKIAKDLNKDQSYFLWALNQDQLKYCMFPLGELTKSEIREIAKKARLSTAKKKDSQGVCFIGEFNMADFLKKYIKPKKGDIITSDGLKVGEHEGVWFYTIGQRHGFGLVRSSFSEGDNDIKPYYIVDKNIKKNQLIVANEKTEKDFYKKEIIIDNVNWMSGITPDLKKIYKARIRYRQQLQSCKIIKNNIKIKTAVIKFQCPQRAVASGQSLVIYDNKNVMIGGGIIR